MTPILPLKDVGDPTKPEGDIFSAEDLNKIYRAMVYVLRVLTDTQASIRPDVVYIGADKTAGLERDPDTGQLVFFDPVVGRVRLANLGALNFACLPVLGDNGQCNTGTAPTANRMYLRYAVSPRDDTLTEIAVGFRTLDTGTLGNATAAVYDTTGAILAVSADTTVLWETAPNFILPLLTHVELTAGTGVWLGIIFKNTHTFPIMGNSAGGHNAKYYDAGGYTVPDLSSLGGIPATYPNAFIPGICGHLAGGMPFS